MSEVFVQEEPREVEIEFSGKKYVFKVKDVTWSQMNKAVNRCTTVTRDGRVSFDIDRYYREMLCEMVVESPKEIPINPISVTKFNTKFGEKLASLVPLPTAGESEFFQEEGSESLTRRTRTPSSKSA